MCKAWYKMRNHRNRTLSSRKSVGLSYAERLKSGAAAWLTAACCSGMATSLTGHPCAALLHLCCKFASTLHEALCYTVTLT